MTETEVISIDRHGQRKEYPSINLQQRMLVFAPARFPPPALLPTAARDAIGSRRRI